MRSIVALCVLAFLAACGAPTGGHEAQPPPAGQVSLDGAWASPTPGGVDVSAGYLSITNGTGAEDRLISVASPRAERVEIHEMSMDGAVMRMRPLEGGLAIAAGATAELAPGGKHLMFIGVAQPFVEGEEIPVSLTFEHAGQVEASFSVRRGEGHGH